MKYSLLILFRPPESSFPPAAEVILQLAGLLFQVATFMIAVSSTTGPLLLCRIQSVSEDLFLQAVELATRATERRQPTELANRLLLLLPGNYVPVVAASTVRQRIATWDGSTNRSGDRGGGAQAARPT